MLTAVARLPQPLVKYVRGVVDKGQLGSGTRVVSPRSHRVGGAEKRCGVNRS